MDGPTDGPMDGWTSRPIKWGLELHSTRLIIDVWGKNEAHAVAQVYFLSIATAECYYMLMMLLYAATCLET